MELVCPAGSPAALDAAVENGADAVYIGFRDGTNARNFAGLNFSEPQAQAAIARARARGVKVFAALNTYPQTEGWQRCCAAVDRAATLGVDAVIAADPGLLDYASRQHPRLPLHLSVQGSATNLESLRFFAERFGIRRAVLPRVLSLAQVQRLAGRSPVPLEVFGFGSLCIMVEGRCQLSSYVTGQSPNTCGVCSPASHVRWRDLPDGGMESRLNDVLIDRFTAEERAGYPTICKGRYRVRGSLAHALEEPVSLNTLSLLPQLQRAGIAAIKLEGRQRSPAYVAQIVAVWRAALDALQREPDAFRVEAGWEATLAAVSEGAQTTLGAYDRPWQ